MNLLQFSNRFISNLNMVPILKTNFYSRRYFFPDLYFDFLILITYIWKFVINFPLLNWFVFKNDNILITITLCQNNTFFGLLVLPLISQTKIKCNNIKQLYLYMHHTQTSTKQDNSIYCFICVISSFKIAIKFTESFDQMCRCLRNQT